MATPPIDPGTTGLAPPTRELRVQACMERMRELRWRRGKTDSEVAMEWGLPLATVRVYSAEASRRVRTEMTDPDHTGATVCVALERVIHEAAAQKNGYGHRAMIEAAKTWALIAGAAAPTRFEVGAFSSMTEEQLEARRRELVAKLSAEQAAPALAEGDAEIIEAPHVPSLPGEEGSH